MKLTQREITKGWWHETRATVPCILPKDGLIVVFNLSDVQAILDKVYPFATFNGQRVWYFNETRDRECAEQEGDRVVANPSVLLAHFMPKP